MADDPSYSFPASRENATEKSQDVHFGVLETSANNLTICSQKISSMSPVNTESLDVRPLQPFEVRTRFPATQPLTRNHLNTISSVASEPPYKRLALSLSLNGSTSGLPSHPETGPLIKLEQPESRAASHSSTTSSLEPLGETFEVPTILLSPGPRHSIAGIPSLSFTNDRSGRIHERPRPSARSISSRALDTSPSSPSSPRIRNRRRTGSGRTRSKSDTTIDPTLLDSASNSIPYASPMSPYSHSHLQPCKDHISPPSSPRFPLLSSVRPSSPLIADVKVSKSRYDPSNQS
ncbi:hypothetical protein CROQUDRAFT_290273 [Cronartium quercuum f. sp. fusiforme G11]|uniref:Uncharacterized protein n=1 Tax=Cronartium quercuum f. sp. fusiforme G11 TaxID=708437 RepID=A0A9P6TEN4_9BASI|nr:hypothetical protein CROQUDRAFT_290273 [Cronartium quercuum f. sp. fusiforme G11]